MEKIRITAVEKTVTNCMIETFDTMLSMDLNKVGKVTDPGLNEKRLVGAVHFAGEVVGTMSLHVSQEFASLMTTAMLGIDESEIDGVEEIKDVLGELANIISGNLKSDFLDSDLACVISTPSITRGSDFKIEASKMGDLNRWIFRHKKHEIIVEISLKEDIGAKREIAGIAQLESAEILSKINSVDIPTTVINAVIDVFYTMLSMETENIPAVPEGFREDKRTVGTVSFAGDVQGLFNIQVNDDFARTMTAAMLGMDVSEIESEEEVFDVMRELSNIIGGNLKSAFVDVGLSCVLSTPAITNGMDFRVESLNIIKTQRFLFSCGGNTIIVDAGIKKDELDAPVGSDFSPEELAKQDAPSVSEEALDDPWRNLDLIMEIPLELTVELGRTSKRIYDVLKLNQGSVVDLVQLEGEPVDLLVNDTLIAKGEVVVEKEKYGIRIVEVVSRMERVSSFRL
ncbi:flagellar motor switch protein FliN [Desulfatitalea tepidiphila]|uniref:flagellar motor switch protein FliN n=1 Tax=Desulfatitalea tepidiphila TaxID=1185843 RepID=UPI0009FAF517|nr:flagellar motor switch protein FliN [Desulfatitalea tepidiphila]